MTAVAPIVRNLDAGDVALVMIDTEATAFSLDWTTFMLKHRTIHTGHME